MKNFHHSHVRCLTALQAIRIPKSRKDWETLAIGHGIMDNRTNSEHLRAVIDCELTSTNMTAPYAVMVNLLGSNLDDPSEVLSMVAQKCPQARIHLYGKEVRPGRKLGHVTVTGDDEQAVAAQARLAVSILRGENV